MPPLSTFDDKHAPRIAFVWKLLVADQHSYSTTASTTKTTKGPPLLAAPKAQQKSVIFNQTVSVRTTLHIHNYSDDEVQACWYNRAEFKAIRKDVKFTVSLLKDGLSCTLEKAQTDGFVRKSVLLLVRPF
jgi:hypothetical protein